MRISFRNLDLAFKKSRELINFTDFSYFYGQIGAGKSSIARLIDYCLGGNIEYTPAMQSEFISATLEMVINGVNVKLTRDDHSNVIIANWSKDKNNFELNIPARKAEKELIPDTGIENLSDFIFYLADVTPPRVRKSKKRADSELGRLSFRDLLWYCYLEQDTIDSIFFNLDTDDTFKKYKSLDVLRMILGYHQEKVTELELKLEEIRKRKFAISESAKILNEVLKNVGIDSEWNIIERINSKELKLQDLNKKIEEKRIDIYGQKHIAEELRDKGRNYTIELELINDAISTLREKIEEDKELLNQISLLSSRIKRTVFARAILNDVNFETCPRCAKDLPQRDEGMCPVCNQDEKVENYFNNQNVDAIEQDKKNRMDEIKESIKMYEIELNKLILKKEEVVGKKRIIDIQLTEALKDYDSSFVSATILLVQEKASYLEEINYLNSMKKLPHNVEEFIKEAERLESEENQIRDQLLKARQYAERDLQNVNKLENLFLDCLIRSQIPGFFENDIVLISSPTFLPHVSDPKTGEFIETTFANIGSGGKKTLFKCCFAVAIHRLVNEIGGLLPTFLIIDSPMKNISEHENEEQFRGFYKLLYELSETELKNHQFIVIDKELIEPDIYSRQFSRRYMTTDNPEYPPLIPYYKGM